MAGLTLSGPKGAKDKVKRPEGPSARSRGPEGPPRLLVIGYFRKDLGDGGLMSQGREAEPPVTTDMNVPFTPE